MNPSLNGGDYGGGGGSSSNGVATTTQQSLYITHVDNLGPYLKICGQLNPAVMSVIRTQLQQQVLSNCFTIDASWPQARQQLLLQPDSLCIYKRINGAAPADYEFRRARIVQGQVSPTAVQVEFLDYGQKQVVPIAELLFPHEPKILELTPAMCSQYILMGICTDWKQSELDEILKMIYKQTLDMKLEMELNQYKFISLKWKEFDFAEFLIHQKKIGAPITSNLLRDYFTKMFDQNTAAQQKQHQQQLLNNNNNIASKPNYNNNYYTNNNNSSNNYNNFNKNANTNIAREQLAHKRSLAARLQQYQQPQIVATQIMPSNVVLLQSGNTIQPRMPNTLGNLHNMMQGIHIQNNRLPYTGVPYGHTSGEALMSAVPSIAYQRYQRPLISLQQTIPQTVISPPRRTTAATFKSNSLLVSNLYDACVSFVENGPCLFSVQLTSSQDELTDMMTRIEKVQLKQLSEKPMLGSACIARYSEDGQLYRALITSVQPNECKVAYIDYGNTEMVKFRDLYEIPDEFLVDKAFAIRMTLSGNKDLEPIDESLKKAFKELVIYQNCKLKVMPNEGPPLVQYCELYMQDKSVLDMLKQIQKTRLVYGKAEQLKNNDIVEIRYIDSPKNFYVQNVNNINSFERLMDDMFLYYNKNQVVPNHLPLGSPVIVKYDKEWYRAEVMKADAHAIIVRHVDFGYEQKVTKNLLSIIAEKHLKLPRQAIQCCLKGFENHELNKDLATTQFEMLAEESDRERRSFTVKVFRVQLDGVHLINLITKDLNVMKKLYKLSMPFNQYLDLEKEEFNVQPKNFIKSNANQPNNRSIAGSENGIKTPSVASSSNVSVSTSNKGNILNSTTLQQQQQLQQQQAGGATKQHNNVHKFNPNISQVTTSVEWDKQSSISSMDNRDARSSSSEQRSQGKQRNFTKNPTNNHQNRQGKNMNAPSIGSDRRSNGSSASGSDHHKNKATPARFNGNKQEQDNRRNGKTMHGAQQQQRSHQRPQNAPQGYAHNTSTSSVRSNETSTSNEMVSHVAAPLHTAEEYLPLMVPFPTQQIVTPDRQDIVLSWFISPHQFYTQLKERLNEFEAFTAQLQQFYKKKPLQALQVKVGSHIIARYRRDNIVFRARVVACNQMLRKYKVFSVDFGRTHTVTSEDIWQVEKRFADFPCMAHLCAFPGIVSNFDHLYIVDRIGDFIPQGEPLSCEYIEKIKDIYYVNIHVNKKSLKAMLIEKTLITEVCSEVNLDLLAGQQIRVKIASIKDMLNFKIQIEGDSNVKYLCSYNDVRYVKSNPDMNQKFKEFYEGKSLVVNIHNVNDNKVLLLSPLMPLLKDDLPTNICSYPIILESFDVRVVYIASATRVYAQLAVNENSLAKLLDEMYEFYEKGGITLSTYEVGMICAAHSNDGNWYRARINSKSSHSNQVEVYYMDYGNTEELPKSNLKVLNVKDYLNISAYAIEVNLPMRILNEQHKSKANSKKTAGSDNETEAAMAAITSALTEMTLNKICSVKALEFKHNHLIAELNTNVDGQIINVLDHIKEKHLIKGRDVDYMRKQLDKEKPNKLEYIETVDLTMEEEENQTERKMPKSPKKKKEKKADQVEVIVASKAEEPKQPIEPAEMPTAAVIEPPEVKMEETPVSAEPSQDVVKETEAPSAAVVQDKVELPDPLLHLDNGRLSSCVNPTQFYIQPTEKINMVGNVLTDLQIVAPSLPPLMTICNGAPCISLYSVDKMWYRARIMDAELLALQFIDYGNCDCVSDASEIKEMVCYSDTPPMCFNAALPIKPQGTIDWPDAANAIFNDSFNELIHYEFLTERPDPDEENFPRNYIELYIDGQNVADQLVQTGFGSRLKTVKPHANCFTCHVNNLNDFYIQYEESSKALELIEIYLSSLTEAAEIKPLPRFDANKIVAALFADDQMWYRAQLLQEIPGEGYKVLFIDYGNESISPQCCEIDAEIADIEWLAHKCALALPENCLGWSEQAQDKFSEITAQGETIFNIYLVEPTEQKAFVKMFIDGRNILEDILPLCDLKPQVPQEQADEAAQNGTNISFGNSTLQSITETGSLLEGIISQVNTPCDFYVQLNKDSIRLEDMTSSLNTMALEALSTPIVGQICAAIFEDDNALYRARIEEILTDSETTKYRVLFIDFGNQALTSDLRTLPQDLLQLKNFAQHCQLENSVKFAQQLVTSTELFNGLVDACEGVVTVEFVNTESQPQTVKLLAGETKENLCAKLNELLMSPDSISTSSVATLSAGQKCLLTYGSSPRLFYLRLCANSASMEYINRLLQKNLIDKQPVLSPATLGTVCSVYHEEDECYYRGRVQTVLADNGGYEIFLLDIGSSLKVSQIRELPQALCSIPALAKLCCLKRIPEAASETLLEEKFAVLLDSHFGELYEIESEELMDDATRLYEVELLVDYKNVHDELMELLQSNADVSEITAPILNPCTIIHVNSVNSFYLQLSADVPAVEKITYALLDAETTFESVTKLEKGLLCAAQFPDDMAFYRARIVEVLDQGKCEVHYIDFGNNSVSEQFRILPDDMLQIEDYSKHCALEESFNNFEAVKVATQFSALIDSRFSETFQVELLKTTVDPHLCRLFYQDKNVAHELNQLLKNESDVTSGVGSSMQDANAT